MPAEFQYDVFLSHNAKDKPRVRRLAERLKQAGLRVWFDEWIVGDGEIIALKVDEGLEQSRVLLLCISSNALASGWVALERSTAIHRDPSNEGRRFIPLLLADCELPDTLRRYKYVDFRKEAETEFMALLNSIRGVTPNDSPKPIAIDMQSSLLVQWKVRGASAISGTVIQALGNTLFFSLVLFVVAYALGWHKPDPNWRLRNAALGWVAVSAWGGAVFLSTNMGAGRSGILGGSLLGAAYLVLATFDLLGVSTDKTLGFSSGAAALGGAIGSSSSYLYFAARLKDSSTLQWRLKVRIWPLVAFFLLALVCISLSVIRSEAALSLLENGAVLGAVLGIFIGGSFALSIFARTGAENDTTFASTFYWKLVVVAMIIGTFLGLVNHMLKDAFAQPVYAICIGFLAGVLGAAVFALLYVFRSGVRFGRVDGLFEGVGMLLLFGVALYLRLFEPADRYKSALPIAIVSMLISVPVSVILHRLTHLKSSSVKGS